MFKIGISMDDKFTPGSNIIDSDEWEEDHFIVYAGLFGIPSYLYWYSASDKGRQFSIGQRFSVCIYEPDSFGVSIYWEGIYIVKSIKFDMKQQMFEIFAIDNFFIQLRNETQIETKVYDKLKVGVDGSFIIADQLSKYNLTTMAALNLIPLVRYSLISFDIGFTLLDLISKICNENMWEWCIASNALYINNLYIQSDSTGLPLESVPDTSDESVQIIKSGDFLHAVGRFPTAPGHLFKGRGRVIWVKYNINLKTGGESEFMVYLKDEPINEKVLYDTLDGKAKELALEIILKNRSQIPLILGKIKGTPTALQYQQYKSPTFIGDTDLFLKDPKQIRFKTNYTPKDKKVYNFEDTLLTTPYAGNAVGLLFPQGEAHHVLLTNNNNRELALIGPAFYGLADVPPTRLSAQDFRLQLPDGAVIYNNNNSKLIIVAPKELDLSVGSMTATQTTAPVSASNINMSTDGIEISSPSTTVVIEITNTGVTIEYGANTIEVTASDVKINKSTLKVMQGMVEIQGNLKVMGQGDFGTLKTMIHPNIDGAIKPKLVPGT